LRVFATLKEGGFPAAAVCVPGRGGLQREFANLCNFWRRRRGRSCSCLDRGCGENRDRNRGTKKANTPKCVGSL